MPHGYIVLNVKTFPKGKIFMPHGYIVLNVKTFPKGKIFKPIFLFFYYYKVIKVTW